MIDFIFKNIAQKLNPKLEALMQKEEAVKKIINKYVLISMGAGAVPIPFVDIAALTSVQLEMLKRICEQYNTSFSAVSGRNLIVEIAGADLTKVGASLIKAIPGLGPLISGIPMVTVSGASTYAMGKVFVAHLNSGGTLENFDIPESKDLFKKEFERGKEYVKNLKIFKSKDKEKE